MRVRHVFCSTLRTSRGPGLWVLKRRKEVAERDDGVDVVNHYLPQPLPSSSTEHLRAQQILLFSAVFCVLLYSAASGASDTFTDPHIQSEGSFHSLALRRMRRPGMKILLVALALASGGGGGLLCLADEQAASRGAAAEVDSESAARLEQSLEQLKAEREEAVKKEDFAAALDIQNQITLLESMIGNSGGVDLNAGKAAILDIVDDNAAAAAAAPPVDADLATESSASEFKHEAGNGKSYNMASLLESLRLHKDKKTGIGMGNDEGGVLGQDPVGAEGADTSNEGSAHSSDIVDSPEAGDAGSIELEDTNGGNSGHDSVDEEESDGSALREWLAANADLLADDDDDDGTAEDIASVNASPGDVSVEETVILGNDVVHANIEGNDDGRYGEKEAVGILNIDANDENANGVDEDAGHQEREQHQGMAETQAEENHESDPCSSDAFSCGANGQCQVIDGDARCICDAGWEGELCADDADDCMVATDTAAAVQDSPCGVHGTCRDIGTNAFLCSCAEGWSGFACEEHDPCLENPCGSYFPRMLGALFTQSLPSTGANIFLWRAVDGGLVAILQY